MSHAADAGRKAGAKQPLTCYVTDRKALAAPDAIAALHSSIRAAVAAGIDWVQIREKDLPAGQLLALVKAAMDATVETGAARSRAVRIIVNDRLDVALAARAGGVHLGRQSISAAEVVRWCRSGNAPAEFSIGVSCHSVADAQAAEAAAASYAFFGPVFDTPSKRPFGSPRGIPKLAEACGAVGIPVIAIGGVQEGTAADCLRAGAAGVAAIRLFQTTGAAQASLRGLISRLHEFRADA